MLHIVGASSFHAAIDASPRNFQRQIFPIQTSVGGLSINPATKKNYQSIQKNDDKLILWHDLINNTVAPHHSSSWKPCSVELLLSILHGLRHWISTIVYTKRTNTTDIIKRLRIMDILIIPVKKLLSTRKRKNNRILRDSRQTHPSLILEERLIRTVSRNRKYLKKLVLKKRSKSATKKSKKQSTSKRRQKKNSKK